MVDDIKRRPYDLLDASRTQFDRDLLEFGVQINDLEAALQVWSGVWCWCACVVVGCGFVTAGNKADG